ncbi:MAG: hypothetical protein WA807_12555 [Steroidobacteraceae bacterium]
MAVSAERGKARQVGGVDEIRVFDAQSAVAPTVRLLQTLVRIKHHVHRIGPQRMRRQGGENLF